MSFAPEYTSLVLAENFDDARRLFLGSLLAIHRAHLVMLAECGIVSRADARRLRDALDGLSETEIRQASFDGTHEDLFFLVDHLLIQACGAELAGRLHTARSRNDIDMTMYRMRQREALLELLEATLQLRRVLIDLAERHRETIFPAHTHTQPAQPSTLAHYLLGVIEQLERDAGRLRAAYGTTNRCPLGACAITGTGFPIDRTITSDLLGFAAPTGNTYGSIAAVDFMLENAAATAISAVGLGRFVQDLLLWATAEFGALRLGNGFVQRSSIMPQKRNPVALEHARAIASRALGGALAVLAAVHNTPFGDIVDTEDDLQPLVFTMFRDATRAVALVAAAMGSAAFDTARLGARARAGGITLTELADTIVRDHGVAFSSAHAIAARVAAAIAAGQSGSLADVLAEASAEVVGRRLEYSEARLAEILSPEHFVDVRHTAGGPSPGETARAVADASNGLAADEQWAAGARKTLADSAERLRERSARL